MRPRDMRRAHVRAGAILRDRLSPAQCADVKLTDWFNVLDALGCLWRVHAGTCVHYNTEYDENVGAFAFPIGMYPNLVDELGQGRTMYDPSGTCPVPDVGLAVYLTLVGSEHEATMVHHHACSESARCDAPTDACVETHYLEHGEPHLVTSTGASAPSDREALIAMARQRHRVTRETYSDIATAGGRIGGEVRAEGHVRVAPDATTWTATNISIRYADL